MPRTRLVARHEIAHARNIRKRWRAHCGRDRQRAQFPAPRCRNLRRGSFIASSQEVPVVASHAKGGGDGTGLTRLCCTAFVRSWPQLVEMLRCNKSSAIGEKTGKYMLVLSITVDRLL